MTLNATFLVPLFRDWLLALGFVGANKKPLVDTLLNSPESIVVVPGGAAEALHSHPLVYKLHLKHRKGFVKLAVETNTPLIPCIGFGENEIFDTLYSLDGTASPWKQWLWKCQQISRKALSFSLPLFFPHPRPVRITVVAGKPLMINPKLSMEEHHVLYMDKVAKLFEKYKKQCGLEHVTLEMV